MSKCEKNLSFECYHAITVFTPFLLINKLRLHELHQKKKNDAKYVD